MCKNPIIRSQELRSKSLEIERKCESTRLRLAPIFVLAFLPLLPTWCYVNRGFTQWFHWVGVLYLLTNWSFLERFQVISGISICLGWYSALCYAAIAHGQFCFILYENMPLVIKDQIFHSGTGEIQYESTNAKAMMFLSHLLDFVGHPLLTYYFWRRHKRNGGNAADIFLSWPIISTSYIFSRLWSLTHMLYNYGKPGYFYIGHDIYIMQHLDCWVPAYAAESLFYSCVVLYKVFGETKSKMKVKVIHDYDPPPQLAHSESGVSRNSSMESISVVANCKQESRANAFGTDWSRM